MNISKDKNEFDFEFDKTDMQDWEDHSSTDHYEEQIKKSRRNAIFAVVAMICLIAAGVVAVVYLDGNQKGGKQNRQKDLLENNADLKQIVNPLNPLANIPNNGNPLPKPKRTKVPLEDPVKKELDMFFKDYVDALKTNSRYTLAECYDFRGIFSAVNDNLIRHHLSEPYLITDVTKAEKGIINGLLSENSSENIIKFEITQIYRIGFRDSFQVCVDVQLVEGDIGKLSILVHRTIDGFRILNSTSIMLGLDIVETMSDVLYLASKGDQVENQGGNNLQMLKKSFLSLTEGKVDDAEKQIANFNQNFSTKNFNASYHQMKAMIALFRGKNEKVISQCKQIEHLLDETPPFVHYLLSASHRFLGHKDEALKSAEIFAEEFGVSAMGLMQLSLAQFYIGEKEQAVSNAKKSLSKNPNTPSLIFVLGSTGKDAPSKDFSHFLLKMKQTKENYIELCVLLSENQDHRSISIALDEFENKFSSHLAIPYFRAQILYDEKKYADAIKLLKPLLSKIESVDHQQDIEQLYFNLLYSLDESKTLIAYAKTKRKKYFFSYLASGFLRDESFGGLRKLTELYTKNEPTDPALLRYQGELAYFDQKPQQALDLLFFAYEKESSHEKRDPMSKKMFQIAYESNLGEFLFKKWKDKLQFLRGYASHFKVYHDPEKLEKMVRLYQNSRFLTIPPFVKASISVAKRDFRQASEILREATEIIEFSDRVTSGEKKDQNNIRKLYFDLTLRLGTIEGCYLSPQNHSQAIIRMGNQLLRTKNINRLIQLVAESRKQYPSYKYNDYYEGKLAQLKGDWEKAAELFRKGFLNTKESGVYQDALAAALFKLKRPMEAYFLVKKKNEMFSELAEIMEKEKNWIALNTLIVSHRRDFPTDPNLAKYEAKKLIAENHFNEAVLLLKPILVRDSEETQSSDLLSLFAEASVNAGKTIEAYRILKDKNTIYGSLISQILKQKEFDQIPELVKEHRKNNPKYPWLEFHLGLTNEKKKEWAEAVKHYRKGYETASDENKSSYREDLVKAEFYAGNAIKILEEFPTDRNVYDQLANLIYREDNITAEETIGFLETLIERWKKNTFQNHPYCLFWTARISLLEKDNPKAIEIFQTHFQKLIDDKTNATSVERQLVYALIEEKKFEQAKKYAMLGYHRIGDPWLPTLTAISAEDVDEAISWTYDIIDHNITLKRLYHESIVSDILKSPAFKKYRTKYPPPKQDLSIIP